MKPLPPNLTPTVNQLIAILETLKRERGGDARVAIYDRGGDRIKPKRMDEGCVIRGRERLDIHAFTEAP